MISENCNGPPLIFLHDVQSYFQSNGGPTLILTWIPNSTLKKHPISIQNSPNRTDETMPKISPRRTVRPDYAKSDLATPSPSNSPRGSCVSTGSDVGDQYYMDKVKSRPYKKHSLDNNSLNSETEISVSVGSREDYPSGESWSMLHEDIRKLSSSNKSQTDSGIESEEMVQNNVKDIAPVNSKAGKVGTNVNNLHRSKDNNSQGQGDDMSSPETNDGLTSEEQLAAMLNRNKLKAKKRERTDSNKSVSIEMNGDNLVVVTEEVDNTEVFSQEKHSVQQRNINRNSMKFYSNSSTPTDNEPKLDPSSQPGGEHYNSLLHDAETNVATNENSVDANGVSSENTENSNDVTNYSEGLSSKTQVPTNLDLNSENNCEQNGCITTPDISITRCRLSSGSSTTTSGPDSGPPSPTMLNSPDWDGDLDSPSSCSSAQQFSHNLTFPNNSLSMYNNKKDSTCPKDQVCGVFSVDLGKSNLLLFIFSLYTYLPHRIPIQYQH